MSIYTNRERIEKTINLIVSSNEYQDFIRRKAAERNKVCRKRHRLGLDDRLEIRRSFLSARNTKLNIRRKKERYLKKIGKG